MITIEKWGPAYIPTQGCPLPIVMSFETWPFIINNYYLLTIIMLWISIYVYFMFITGASYKRDLDSMLINQNTHACQISLV